MNYRNAFHEKHKLGPEGEPQELIVKTPASKKKTVVEEEECVLVEEVTAIARKSEASSGR